MRKSKLLSMVLATSIVLTACGASGGSTTTTRTAITETASTEAATEAEGSEAGVAGTVDKPYIITFGNTSPESTDPENGYTLATQALNDKLMELSGGTLGFELVRGGVYGSTVQHLAQVKQGTLDGMITGFDVATNLDGAKDFAACAMPYVFNSDEHIEKFMASDLWAGMVENLRKTNGIIITGMFMHQPARTLNSKTAVVHPEDVKGMKIRVPESDVQIRVWDAAGASPVQVAGSELYSALDTGIADAQENDIVSSSGLKMYEVAPYFNNIEYIRQAQLCYMSEITWNKMNDQEKEWWNEATAAANEAGTAAYAKKMDTAKQEIVDNGGTITEVDYNEWKDFFTTIVKTQFDGVTFRKGLYDEIQAADN